ncbi:MAG: amidase [Firmicutes bacterium]|nr:amidase [Alicyclobacillaceae bacterium]MCL6497121.1 amidase [Bacillota bacterium]
MNPADLDYGPLAEALRQGQLTWGEVVSAYTERIALRNPILNAYVAWSAKASTDPPLPGSLRGLAVAVKDLIDCAGFPTRAGSSFFLRADPADAFAVAALRLEGAWMVGKTNTHEFAAGGTTLNPHFGPTLNPWDRNRLVGGSSGGSAAAVAARMAVAALGTDTAGSVRIPAAFTGVVGLKPTYGRISRRGVVPLSWSLDHVGPLARTVADTARVFWAMARPDPKDPTTVSRPHRPLPEPLRVGVVEPSPDLALPWDPEVASLVKTAAGWLEAAGARLVPTTLPRWKSSLAANFTIIRAESATYHRRWLRAHPDRYGVDVRTYLEAGMRVPAVDYLEAQRVRSAVVADYQRLFETVDLLVLPTVPILPPPVAEAPLVGFRLTEATAPFDLSGLPAISLPVLGPSRLPVGIQLVAPWWHEAWLFAVGERLEAARGPMPPPDGVLA